MYKPGPLRTIKDGKIFHSVENGYHFAQDKHCKIQIIVSSVLVNIPQLVIFLCEILL